MADKEYTKAAKAYRVAHEFLYNTRPLYKEAIAWAKAGKNKKALNSLEQAVDNGGIRLDYVQKDSNFIKIHESSRWQELISDMKIADSKMDVELKKRLSSIKKRDQIHRKQMKFLMEAKGPDSEEVKALNRTIEEADSANLVNIVEIIDQYGYPGKTLVGSQAKTAYLVILHANDLELQKKYLPIFQRTAANNELEFSSLALLIDKIQVAEGKKQVYGTQYTFDEDKNKYYFYPIENRKNINRTRKKAGLPPLENYAQQFNIQLSKQ